MGGGPETQEEIDRDILKGKALKKQSKNSLKATHPKAPQKEKAKLMKAPPKNLDKPEQERLPREVSVITEDISSEESEEWGKMQAGPIGID